MKYLTLIRRAKSSWDDPSLDDFDRPLNRRGKSNAPEMGQRLFEQGIIPDAIFTSPAKRARKTARLFARELAIDSDAIHYVDELYHADALALARVIRTLDDRWNDVFLFGHNPGVTDLANFFVPDGIKHLQTCAVVRIDLPFDSWSEIRPGQAAVVLYDYPKKPSNREP
jgi:phosphohistidine phosphatase